MHKVIISLAPVEAGKPIDYSDLIDDIDLSVQAGASIVHLHSRDAFGSMSPNCQPMIACFSAARDHQDFIVQASTGGISNMDIVARTHPLDYPIIESCSLNGGSTNLGEYVYQNSFGDIRYVAEKAYQKQIIPEIEVFDIGMIQAVESLAQDTPFMIPKLYNLVFGHPGGMLPTIGNLVAFKAFVPQDSLWGVTQFGRINWDFLACAITMGATDVRIGFEDSHQLDSMTAAQRNVDLVVRLRQLIEAIGYGVATPAEARSMIHISKKKE